MMNTENRGVTGKVSKKAMQFVEKYEAENNRKAQDVSNQKELGYDILSGNRKIEVKGTSRLWKFMKNHYSTVPTSIKNATHLYLICNVLDEPDLHIFEINKLPPEALKVYYHLCFGKAEEVKR